MQRPDEMKTPAAVRAAGVKEQSKEAGNLKTDFSPHGATVAQRRADSLRLHAIGQIGGGHV
jgi:hypothetical protein